MSGEGEGAPSGHPDADQSGVMSAADYKRWLQTLRAQDLVDMSDISQSVWTTGRVFDVASDAIHCGPVTPQQHVRSDWILKSSGRLAKPHTHWQTNKNIKPPAAAAPPPVGARPASAAAGGSQQAVNAAAASLASLSVSNGGKPAGSPAAGSPLLPLPAAPASAGNSPNPGASPRNPPAAAAAAGAKPAAAAASSAPAASAAPVISDAELKKFRTDLKVGDLVDFESHVHRSARSNAGLWYLGEVSRIDQKFMPFSTPDVFVHNHTKGDIEFMPRDSQRLWPPMTKTVQQQAAQQAAAQQSPQAQARAGEQPSQQQQNLAQPVARQGQLPPVQGRPGNVAGNAALAAANPLPAASPQPGQAGAAEGAPGGAPGGAPVAAAGGAASPVAAAAGQAPPESVPPPVDNYGYQLRKGDVADCLDTEQKWRLIEVIATDPTHVLVHYVDWSSKWDEWIPKTDARIQPPRTRTEGYTGPANKKPVVPVFKPPPPPPVPVAPPRPSYSCLAACSWHRVLSSGLSHKEITALNDLFASCCYVQDTYQEVLLGTQQTPVSSHSAYSSYWSSPPPPPVFKHTLASVTELLTKLEKDIETQTAALPSSCAFMLSQASTIAVNIRGLILDSEETTRRQLLLQQEDLFMQRLKEQFRIVEVPSDGSCLFSAVGMGQQLRQAAVGSSSSSSGGDATKLASSKKPAAEDDAAVAMSDVHVSISPSEEKSGESDDAAKASSPACADPALVLQLLHDSADSHLQQIVAAKCRAQLVAYLRAHTAAVSSPSASGSASASAASDSSQQWLDRIKSEVKEVLQQESAGKYSDATSKAVWEELSAAAKAAAAQQQAAGGAAAAASSMGSAAPTPLSLADTPAAVEAYIKVMSQEGIYGTGVEIEALSEMLRAPIHIYYRSAEAPAVAAAPGEAAAAASMPPERIVGEQFSGPPISLAYYMGQKHYNLLVDRKAIPPPPAKHVPSVGASGASSASSSSASASPPAPAVSASSAAASTPPGELEGKSSEQPGVDDASASAPGGPGEVEGVAASAVGGADASPTLVVPADQPMLQVQEPEMAPFTCVVPEPSAPAAASASAAAPQSKPSSSAMAAVAAARREEKRASGGAGGAAAGAAVPTGAASPQFTIQTPVSSSYPFVPSSAAAAGVAAGAAGGPAAAAPGARPAPIARTGSGGSSAPGSGAPSPSHHGHGAHGLAAGAPSAAATVPRASAPPASAAGVAAAAAAAPHGSRPVSAASSPVVSSSHPPSVSAAAAVAGHPQHAPPSYSASVSSQHSSPPPSSRSNILSLLVHFPGGVRHSASAPLPTPVYRDQQLVSLVNHPAIQALPPQDKTNIKFFVNVGADWEEVDARKTPDQLKLKENTHIGIKLPHS